MFSNIFSYKFNDGLSVYVFENKLDKFIYSLVKYMCGYNRFLNASFCHLNLKHLFLSHCHLE